jgi:uncharacterized protein
VGLGKGIPYLVDTKTPAHHVLRPHLRHRVGVHTVLELPGRLAIHRCPHRDPPNQRVAGLKELGLRMIRWRVRWYWYVLAIEVPLAVLVLTVGLNVALGAGAPSLGRYSSVTTVLMVFAVRLINSGDGALGEEPGWRGFSLPGLQSTLSPLVSTLILGVLVTVWHVPTLFLEEIDLGPQIVVGFLLGSFAVTFFYTWLFNHTGGSVLLSIVSHAAQGTITIGGLWAAGAAFAQANLITGFV